MAAKRNVVLAITVGRTDLQLLADSSGELVRLSVGSGLRQFHQALVDQKVPWVLDAKAANYREASVRDKAAWDQGDLRLPDGYSEHLNPEGNLVLVPAKLAEAVLRLKDYGSFEIRAVVVLTTNRDERTPPGIFHNEPIAAGPILAHWLADEFGLECGDRGGDIAVGRSGWVDILTDDELSPMPGRHNPVHRKALQRTEDALRRLVSEVAPDPWACLSLGGGMAEMKEPIKACAQFLFDGRTFTWQAPQYSVRDFQWVPPDEEPPTATDSYRLRRHVSALVRRGAFVEAYGAASELELDPEEQNWVAAVEQVARYFSGELSRARARRQGLFPPLEPMVRSGVPRCLLAAMRVEAGLWTERLSEAVIGSVTFLEAAILDVVGQNLSGRGLALNDAREQIGGHDGKLTTLATKINRWAPKDRRQPLRKSHGVWEYSMGIGQLSCWAHLLEPKPAAALETYRDALTTTRIGGHRLIDLRHLAVHSVLPVDILNRVGEGFHDAGIWGQPGVPGEYFLKTPLVHAVLDSAGIVNGADLYADLVNGMLEELRTYRIA